MISERQIATIGIRPGMPARIDRDADRFPFSRTGRFPRIVVTWLHAVNFLVPVGYQDETGFHYGEVPAGKGTEN